MQPRTNALEKERSQISQITYVDYIPNVLEVELLPPVAQFVYPCTERWNANPYGVFGGLSRVAGVNHLCLRMGGTFPEDDGTEVVATALGPYYDGDRASSQDPARGGLDVRAQLGDRGGADRVVVERRLEEDLGAALRPALDAAACPRSLVRVFALVVVEASEICVSGLGESSS